MGPGTRAAQQGSPCKKRSKVSDAPVSRLKRHRASPTDGSSRPRSPARKLQPSAAQVRPDSPEQQDCVPSSQPPAAAASSPVSDENAAPATVLPGRDEQHQASGVASEPGASLIASRPREPTAAQHDHGHLQLPQAAAQAVEDEVQLLAGDKADAAQRVAAKAASSTDTQASGDTIVNSRALSMVAPPSPDDVEAVSPPDDMDEWVEFDPWSFIKHLPPLEQAVPQWRQPLLAPQTRRSRQKTLVLDLDETLVHSSLEAADAPDFTFPVTFNGAEHTVHVRQRPGLLPFLERATQLFEVVVFTASQKVYAEQLLNIVDPQRRLVRHRVFRESCVLVAGNYVKDLSVLGRDLAQTIIVDNSPQAFGFQLSNGIPIESWYDAADDAELSVLLQFLEQLVDVEDVRPLIREHFKLHELVAAAPSWPAAIS